jgi:hypothetical protein
LERVASILEKLARGAKKKDVLRRDHCPKSLVKIGFVRSN